MDNLTKEQRNKNMRNIKSVGTLPERLVMKELRSRKIYFAANVSNITGKPDIVFRQKKIAVFIDSDFWHGHPNGYVPPKTNRNYWKKKILRNKERDREVNRELRKQGWKVMRFWEKDIKKNPEKCVLKIVSSLESQTE